MKKKEQHAVIAGLLLGEGCIRLKNKNNTCLEPQLSIGMGDIGTISFCHKVFGGKIVPIRPWKRRLHTLYRWYMAGAERILNFLLLVRPYCTMSTEKLKQIDIMIEFCQMPDRRIDRSKALFRRQVLLAKRLRALKPRNQHKL